MDEPQTTTKKSAPRRGGAARVLAVDDEESVLEIVRESLGRCGFVVDTASDGRAALAKLGERRYDLLVSDIRMPGMTGPQLYAVLRDRWPELAGRTLFLTGDVGDRALAFLVEAGVPYLEKPFEIGELVEAVRRAGGFERDDGTGVTEP